MALFTTDRPNPLKDVATKVGTVWSGLAGVIGVVVTLGGLSAAQGDAVTAAGEALDDTVLMVGGVLGFVLPFVAGLAAAFGTASKGEKVATPSEDPVDTDGAPLVREDGATPKGVLYAQR